MDDQVKNQRAAISNSFSLDMKFLLKSVSKQLFLWNNNVAVLSHLQTDVMRNIWLGNSTKLHMYPLDIYDLFLSLEHFLASD